jgi:hypothetical protein
MKISEKKTLIEDNKKEGTEDQCSLTHHYLQQNHTQHEKQQSFL